MHEGCTIQRQLTRNLQRQQKSDDGTARIFSKLMMEGKVRAALRLVTQTNGCGSLSLNNLANSNDPTRAQTVFHNSSTSTVIRLYITLVRPILEYCAVIWDPSSPLSHSLDSVQRFTIKNWHPNFTSLLLLSSTLTLNSPPSLLTINTLN